MAGDAGENERFDLTRIVPSADRWKLEPGSAMMRAGTKSDCR